MVAADARTAVKFRLSAGQDHDAPHGRRLLKEVGARQGTLFVVMDRAYEGDETRQLVLDLGYEPVVPPSARRRSPWVYDQALYKRRNEIERLFRRLKGYRRVFSRFDKLDVVFVGFITFALIIETLRSVNTP